MGEHACDVFKLVHKFTDEVSVELIHLERRLVFIIHYLLQDIRCILEGFSEHILDLVKLWEDLFDLLNCGDLLVAYCSCQILVLVSGWSHYIKHLMLHFLG